MLSLHCKNLLSLRTWRTGKAPKPAKGEDALLWPNCQWLATILTGITFECGPGHRRSAANKVNENFPDLLFYSGPEIALYEAVQL